MAAQVLPGQMLPAPHHPLHLIINPQIFGQGPAKHDHGADVLGGGRWNGRCPRQPGRQTPTARERLWLIKRVNGTGPGGPAEITLGKQLSDDR